jgi:hypothetical protein
MRRQLFCKLTDAAVGGATIDAIARASRPRLLTAQAACLIRIGVRLTVGGWGQT